MSKIKPFSIDLVPGVTGFNFWTYLYAAFVCVGMMAGMNFIQGYILTEHLMIAKEDQGRVAGDLAFWTEIVAILLLGPFGGLSDRIGRRPILIIGTALIGLGYTLYPFATSLTELTFYRLIYAVGSAATVAAAITIQNDYPQEQSRGKMVGISAIMNGLGIVVVAGVMGRLPLVLSDWGLDPIAAGKYTLGLAAMICALSVVLFQYGLKGSTPVSLQDRPSPVDLLKRGLKSARNPRIALSYGSAFTARSDLAISGLFISLWAIQAGQEAGISSADAMSRAVIVLVVSNGITLLWAPIFGVFADRFNRVTVMATSLGLASAGFMSMALVSSPLDYAMLPFFALLGIGANSAIMASVILVGQEANPEERGTVIGVSGVFGAVGILFATAVGGRLFDAWAPYAPFVVIGFIQGLLLVVALIIRFKAAGPMVTVSSR